MKKSNGNEIILEKAIRIRDDYEVRHELVLSHFEDLPKDHRVRLTRAYTLSGDLIGEPEFAATIIKRGIAPEIADESHTICSIGWCNREQKWYGWSHRQICGFGIGSSVKREDCAYMPTDKQDLLDDLVNFWARDEDEFTTKTMFIRQLIDVFDPSGDSEDLGVLCEREHTRKKDGVLLKVVDWRPYPEVWGQGEWTAKTLNAAKQMALVFAKNVS